MDRLALYLVMVIDLAIALLVAVAIHEIQPLRSSSLFFP